MFKYFQRRLLQAIPTFFGVTFIVFIIILAAPGDPIDMITWGANSNQKTTKELKEAMRRQLGLDRPPLEQYLYWMIGNDWTRVDYKGDGIGEAGKRRGLLRGDLGDSIKQKKPVMDLIVQRIPATLRLGVAALILGYLAGVMLGALAAVFHRTWLDQVIRIISVVGNAVPAFWLGLLLIIVFGVQLKWLPISGMEDITRRGGEFDLGDALRHMILPVFVLSLNTIAFISRFTRTQMLETLQQDYVRTAYAKGLQTRLVWLRHALKNSLLPAATFFGPSIGFLLAGAVIIEHVFQWPGMGKLVIDAVSQRDYPLVMGSVVVASVMFMIGVLISDALYVILDPRIRLE